MEKIDRFKTLNKNCQARRYELLDFLKEHSGEFTKNSLAHLFGTKCKSYAGENEENQFRNIRKDLTFLEKCKLIKRVIGKPIILTAKGLKFQH